MVTYCVCYYSDRGRYQSVKDHLEHFQSLPDREKSFLVVCTSDSTCSEGRKRAAERLGKKLLSGASEGTELRVIASYNWGGTVAALWTAYKHLQSLGKERYVAMFEEDFLPINGQWLTMAKSKLSEGNIYVGETCYNAAHHSESFDGSRWRRRKELSPDCRPLKGKTFSELHEAYGLRTGGSSAYTDGGLYFSTVEKLKLIEDKIGFFHKGSTVSRYDRELDGIVLGEVGFPSEVARHFPFVGLERKRFFTHDGKQQGDDLPFATAR